MLKTFNQEEHERYQRHFSLKNFGIEGQKKLKQTSVFIVGLGGIGSPLVLYLSALGIGRMGIMDGDCIELSNLQRQILYDSQTIGEKKTLIAYNKIKAMNQNINIEAYDHYLTIDEDTSFLQSYDFIIDGSDNFKTRFLLNGLSLKYQLPLISASVLDFSYQVALYNLNKNTPCLNCLYPNIPKKDSIPNCSDNGVLGIIPGQAALLSLNLLINYLLGKINEAMFYFFNGEAMKLDQFKLTKDPLCNCCSDFLWEDFKIKYKKWNARPLLNRYRFG